MSTEQQNEKSLVEPLIENNAIQHDEDLLESDCEIAVSNIQDAYSETSCIRKKKKMVLCVVACLLIVAIVLSSFVYITYSKAYSKAENKCKTISQGIAKMEISQKDLGGDDSLENKLYEKHFKEKNEQDIVDLLKRNFYAGSSNLVNTDSISNIKKVKKVCDEFALDETKYADVYLYINTALKLEEYARYNKLSKHLEDTVPLLTNINTSSYYTIDMVAITLQQCIDSLTIVVGMIQGDMSDSQVYRYYEIVRKLGECIIDAVKAGQKNKITKMQEKLQEYAYVLLEVYELLDEVDKVQKEVIAGMAELIEIEKRINMQ